MSQTNLEEIDVSDLSFEELDSLLNEVEGKPNNNLEADTNAESQTDKEETDIETSSTDVENVDVNATESSDKTSDVDKADVEDNTEEKESIEPQFQGKSKDDLREMQRNATKKISKQNNEIYHLEQRLKETLETRIEEKKETDESNDILHGYESSDIKAIETLVNKVLADKKHLEKEQVQRDKDAVMKEHDELWDNFSVVNPELFDKVKDNILEEMRSNPETTVFKKGWLKGVIKERIKDGSLDNNQKAKKNRKVVTTIMGSNGMASSINSNQKSVADMTAEEYLKYMNSQGVQI